MSGFDVRCIGLRLRGCPHILRVDKEGDEEAVPHNERWMHSQMQAALVSCRQAVEWGMGTFQKSFKRLTLKLTNMPKKRALIIALCVRLQHFRTRNVGLNQITATGFSKTGH